MNIDENKKKMLKNILKCSLCFRLYHNPITLFCQDTFCKSCIKNYSLKNKTEDCPKCHKQSFYPPINNFKLCDLISKLYPEDVKSRELELSRITPKLTDEEEIKEDIIKNNWRDIINKKTNNSNLNQQQHQQMNQFLIEQIF
jgi:hypothetical protein